MSFYKNNKYREFPEHRVCVIDSLPLIEKSVKETYNFFLQLNVPSSFFNKNKKDVLNVFYHHLFNNFYTNCEQINTKYRKVIAIFNFHKKYGIPEFFYKNIKTALKACPVKWCLVTSLNDAETGITAAIAAEKTNEQHSKLFKFIETHNLKGLKTKIKNKRFFSDFSVDFSRLEK